MVMNDENAYYKKNIQNNSDHRWYVVDIDDHHKYSGIHKTDDQGYK